MGTMFSSLSRDTTHIHHSNTKYLNAANTFIAEGDVFSAPEKQKYALAIKSYKNALSFLEIVHSSYKCYSEFMDLRSKLKMLHSMLEYYSNERQECELVIDHINFFHDEWIERECELCGEHS